MTNDNVTPITKLQSPKTTTVTLENLKKEFDAWRMAKTKRNQKIPATFWDQIFFLVKTQSEYIVLSTLSLSNAQFKKEKQARLSMVETKVNEIPSVEPMEFCEASSEQKIPLAYKPAQAFTTTTSVVELYRPDGMLMKIHLCTDRFEELLRAFFKG